MKPIDKLREKSENHGHIQSAYLYLHWALEKLYKVNLDIDEDEKRIKEAIKIIESLAE